MLRPYIDAMAVRRCGTDAMAVRRCGTDAMAIHTMPRPE
jgi:hypothetical protein